MKFRMLILLAIFSILSAQEFAFIYIENNIATNTVGTTWTNVGAGNVTDFTESSTSSNWSYNENVLTPTVAGTYSIKYSLSFGADEAVWSLGLRIGGAAGNVTEPVFTRTISNKNKDTGNMSGIFIADLVPGQSIEMVVKSSDSKADNFKPSHAQLVITPAAQNPANLYAGMNINASTPLSESLTTEFTKLIGFSAVPEINGWTFGSSDLTANAGSAGLYYMSYSVSFMGDSPESSPSLYTVDLAIDGTTTTHILSARTTSQEDIGNISGGGLVTINTGDIITLRAKSTKTGNMSIHNATVSMFKVGVAESPQAIGAATIISDQSVAISAQDTWTTVGTYISPVSVLWDFSSNVFTPNSAEADGFYYLEYATSLSTENANGDDIKLGVFVGDSEKPNLTVKRRLSSNTDMGAVCGVGLFSVDDFTSTITLKIKNTTSPNDLTIGKSALGFSQIRYLNDPATPITLNSFNVEEQNGAINLNWQTASEVENLGYIIYRKVDDGMFEEVSSYVYNDALQGQGTISDFHDYEFIDRDVELGKEYTYMLSDVSCHMIEMKQTDFIKTIYLAKGIEVSTAYPNPFNPQSTILYTLDKNENVKIELLDISGKSIRTLVNKDHVPGNYKVSINEPALGSGIYLVRVQAGSQLEVQKIMMLK